MGRRAIYFRKHEMNKVSLKSGNLASLFFEELENEYECLSAIEQTYGAQVLVNLMYLHSSILNSGYTEVFDDEEGGLKTIELLRRMPSSEKWLAFIQLETDKGSELLAESRPDLDDDEIRIIIELEGARISGVTPSADMTVFIMDYDLLGDEPEDQMSLPSLDADGTNVDVNDAVPEMIKAEPSKVEMIFTAIDR
jgi:hypothetical protein